MRKKITAFILVLVIVVCAGVLPERVVLQANASEELTYGDYKYTVDNGEVTIIDYAVDIDTDVDMIDIDIPSSINGYPVVEIGEGAFGSIGWVSSYDGSFHGVMRSVSIPNTVKKIGRNAFSNNDYIEEITIPESVEIIDAYAFGACDNLNLVKGCDGLKEIGRQAFSYCPIETIKLPKSLTKIDKNVFYGCEKLVTAGPSSGNYNIQYDWDVEIPVYAFAGLESLQTVDFPDTLENFAGGCFMDCTGLANLKLPNSVTKIESATFSNTGLVEFNIPASVTFIGMDAFAKCKNLERITGGVNLETLGFCAFRDCESLEKITLSEKITNMKYGGVGSAAFSGCKKLKSAGPVGGDFNIEYGWKTEIPIYAFSGADYLETIIFPDTMQTINMNAFSRTALKNVNTNKIKYISSNAFEYCKQLETFVGGESLEAIGNSAFNDCENLTTVVFNSSPDYVANKSSGKVFENCPNLKTVGPLGGDYDIRINFGEIFPPFMYFSTGIESVVIPEGVTKISESALSGTAIKEVVLPSTLRHIGYYAFSNCSNLEKIIGGKNVTIIGNGAIEKSDILEIYGYLDTSIEKYAKEKNIPFYPIDGKGRAVYVGALDSLNNKATLNGTAYDIEPSEMSKLSQSVGKYAVANIVPLQSVDAIEPVTSSQIGNLDSIDYDGTVLGKIKSLTIDGIKYEVTDALYIPWADTTKSNKVIYHIIDNKLIGIEILKENKGTIKSWNKDKGEVTIDSYTYGINFLSDTTYLEALGGTYNSYCTYYVGNSSKDAGGKPIVFYLQYDEKKEDGDGPSIIFDDMYTYGQYKKPETPEEILYDAVDKYNMELNDYYKTLEGEMETEYRHGKNTAESLKEADKNSKEPILTFSIADESEKKVAEYVGYRALADYLQQLYIEGAEIGRIKDTNNTFKISSDIINEIMKGVHEAGQIYTDDIVYNGDVAKHNNRSFHVVIRPIGFNYKGLSGSIGFMSISGNGKTWDIPVRPSAGDMSKVLETYLNDLGGVVNDRNRKALFEVVKEFARVSGISEVAKKMLEGTFAGKISKYAEQLASSGYGQVLNGIDKAVKGYESIKYLLNINKANAVDVTKDSLLRIFNEIQKIDHKDSTVKVPAVKTAIDELKAAQDYLLEALYNSIYGGEKITVERFLAWIKIRIHCPVDFDVYDDSSTLIGTVRGGAATFDESKIRIEIDGEKKTLYVAPDVKVRIEMVGTGYGELNYSVEEYKDGKPTGRLNFYSIKLSPGIKYTHDLTSISILPTTVDGIPLITENGNSINASEYLSVTDSNANITVTANAENGMVMGDRKYPKGDLVVLYSIPLNEEDYDFDGWYENGELVEVNRMYMFTAKQNSSVTAKFILKNKLVADNNPSTGDGEDIPFPPQNSDGNNGTGNNNSAQPNRPSTGGNASTSNPSGTLLTRLPVTTPSKNDKDKDAGENGGVKYFTLYRLYNVKSGEHLYTIDTIESAELVRLGWQQETTPGEALSKGVPIYRLYNPASGGHLYTPDENECKVLTSEFGWVYDNNKKPVFYGKVGDGTSVFRLYNPGIKSLAANHHYTSDKIEIEHLIRNSGWVYDNDKVPVFILK